MTAHTASQRAANRRGILCMSAAMACFVTNDALVKYVSQSLPSAQLIFLRGVFASVLVLAAARLLGATGRLGTVANGTVLLRAALDAIATLLYLSSLFELPIGNATAINLAAPIFMTVFAVLFMAERVAPMRWAAIGIGFAGVLCVIQPRADGFNAYALLCLAGTLFHAARDLLTRRIDSGIPAILVTLATALAVTLLSGGLSLVQGWLPVAPMEFVRLALAAVFLAAGYYLIIEGMRSGELSLVAPFRYSGLLFAVAIGFVVWGDVPNAWAWLGIALLVGAGLAMLRPAGTGRRGASARS